MQKNKLYKSRAPVNIKLQCAIIRCGQICVCDQTTDSVAVFQFKIATKYPKHSCFGVVVILEYISTN